MYRLKVKDVLKDKGMSQGVLSRRANIPPNLIGRMVNDPENYHPSYDTLFKVAEILGVSPVELVEKIEET